MQLIPPLRQKLELGPRAEGLPRYKWKDGMPFLPNLAGGVLFPQVYCRSVFSNIDNEVHFTDDVVFKNPSDSLLRMLVIVNSMAEAEAACAELQELDLQAIAHGELKLEEVCYLVHNPQLEASTKSTPTFSAQVYRVATVDEFKKSSLFVNRPEPVGYDMYRIRTELQGRRYVLVRPDRFVFAACASGRDLKAACDNIHSVLLAKL